MLYRIVSYQPDKNHRALGPTHAQETAETSPAIMHYTTESSNNYQGLLSALPNNNKSTATSPASKTESNASSLPEIAAIGSTETSEPPHSCEWLASCVADDYSWPFLLELGRDILPSVH